MMGCLRTARVLWALLLLTAGCKDLLGTAVGPDPDSDPETEKEVKKTEQEVRIEFSSSGRISEDQNELHIQGFWDEYRGLDSKISKEIDDDAEQVCVDGYITPPPPEEDESEMDYQNYFGAKVGFFLCTDDADTPHPLEDCPLYDSLEQDLIGIKFDLDAEDDSLPGGILRLQFSEEGRPDGTYVEVEQGDDQTVYFEEAAILYEDDADPIDEGKINRIDFYVSTGDIPEDDETDRFEFEFCISNIYMLANLPE